MSEDAQLDKLLAALGPRKGKGRWPVGAPRKALERTELTPDAPAPQLQALIADQGPEPTTEALKAWDARVNGAPIVDVAHSLGVSLKLAKSLINEVHAAIGEDLRANLELNRALDLQRIDGLISSYYPAAREGDEGAASICLKALSHRAKLTGAEPQPQPTRDTNPTNVLVWIQNQLPNINRLVDALPVE